MDKEIKREALRQYLHYFRVWFIIVGAMLMLFLAVFTVKWMKPDDNVPRGNNNAPAERVYDYADVLTDREEEKLRKKIAEVEALGHFDVILVTINQVMETSGVSWEDAMMNYADDFYDYNQYGYDMVHGDGVLLLDNWYEGQGGSWLCTTGRVYEQFSTFDIDDVLDEVYYYVEDDPYTAYCSYIDMVAEKMCGEEYKPQLSVGVLYVVPLLIALIYLVINLNQKEAENTVQANTYVAEGRPRMCGQADTFIRKNVTSRHIERSSGGGGGGRSSGGRGGSHRSSSGVSHGGGGRRR